MEPRKQSFVWHLRAFGAFGSLFLLIGLLQPAEKFDRPEGKWAFILFGALFSLPLLAVNEVILEPGEGSYRVRKGLWPLVRERRGELRNLRVELSSDSDGHTLFLCDGERRLLQVASRANRERALAAAARASERLGLPRSATEALLP